MALPDDLILNKDDKKRVQGVVGLLLFSARAVDRQHIIGHGWPGPFR